MPTRDGAYCMEIVFKQESVNAVNLKPPRHVTFYNCNICTIVSNASLAVTADCVKSADSRLAESVAESPVC